MRTRAASSRRSSRRSARVPADQPPGGRRTKVVDCFFNPSGEADFSSVDQATGARRPGDRGRRGADGEYLEQGDEIAPDQLHAPFEKALREGHLVRCASPPRAPVPASTSCSNVLVKLAPNPLEGNPPLFYKGEVPNRGGVRSTPDPKKHVLAHVFKVVIDPFVGKLGIFRVHQGTVTRDTQLFIGDGRKPFKVGHLFMLQGAKNTEVDRAIPGDIAAVAKSTRSISMPCCTIRTTRTRSTCARSSSRGRCTAWRSRRRSAATNSGSPTCSTRWSPRTRRWSSSRTRINETVLRALGDLHLRSVLERMASQYKLEIDTRPPRIPYRETIAGNAESTFRHEQTGGAGQFGEVSLRVEPLPRGGGFDFVDATKGGVIPHQFMPAVRKGVEQVLEQGAIAGFPMQDIRVTCSTASTIRSTARRSRSSRPGARPSSKPCRRRVRSCSSRSYRSRSSVRTSIPATSPATCRRAAVRSRARGDGRGCARRVRPRAARRARRLCGALKSVTGGHGAFSMALSHYEPAPPALQQQLVAEFEKRRKHEEDCDR